MHDPTGGAEIDDVSRSGNAGLEGSSGLSGERFLQSGAYTAAAAARPAIRPENRHPPRKVPSRDR